MVSELEGPRFRNPAVLGQPWRWITRIFMVALAPVGAFFIMDAPSYLGWSFFIEQYYGIMLAMVLPCVFLLVPPKKSLARVLPWFDIVLAIAGFAVGLYVALFYPEMVRWLGIITPDRVIMGTLAIVLIFEAVRRFTGWVLVSLAGVFILYARFTWIIPGAFGGDGIPWDRLANSLFLDKNALLGTPMEVTAITVLPFILFGAMLFCVGGGAFLTDFAMSILGRYRGGPAKMAVLASSLFGTISGSAVANVTSTGVFTIPLMKRTGYKAHVAGAIEATASTGGQIMPPVMGAAAFLIPEYTGIPYSSVALAAFIPALLYYIGIFVQVDLEAGKMGLKGLPASQLPSLRGVLKQSYLFVVPLAVLVYALFIMSLSPGKAAFLGVVSIIILGLLRRDTRQHPAWMIKALADTGRGLLELTVVVAMAGFIIGVITFTGVGFLFPLFLGHLAMGNVYLLLIIAAIAALILGMGMPTVAVYVLVAVLLAPSLVELGIKPLAAHLFIFYWGMLSMITPPVCFASFAAAALANADSMRTGYSAMRIGILAYPVPFMFALGPALLLMGSPVEVIVAIVTAILGAFLIGTAAIGFIFRPLSPVTRVVMGLAGVALLMPVQQGQLHTIALFSNIIGGVVAAFLVWWEWRMRKRPRTAALKDALVAEPDKDK